MGYGSALLEYLPVKKLPPFLVSMPPMGIETGAILPDTVEQVLPSSVKVTNSYSLMVYPYNITGHHRDISVAHTHIGYI